MTSPTNPQTLNWTPATTNVDGSPIGPNEITAFEVGVRDTSSPGSAVGVYPFGAKAPATAVSELISSVPNLPVGKPLVFAVREDAGVDAAGNPVVSGWSPESEVFTLPVPAPVPNPPTNPIVG